MTVLENLMVAVDATTHGGLFGDALRLPRARLDEHRSEERARAILYFLGMSPLADELAGDISSGLQRKVELGRALCTRPELLLLDEPAAGLDATETEQLATLLRQMRNRFRLTILLVDHDMALVMQVCQQLFVLDFGRLIAQGPPERIRDDPAVVAAYLGTRAA
jgi:ABC-type branched-subunit amino acid transport system ATPase component